MCILDINRSFLFDIYFWRFAAICTHDRVKVSFIRVTALQLCQLGDFAEQTVDYYWRATYPPHDMHRNVGSCRIYSSLVEGKVSGVFACSLARLWVESSLSFITNVISYRWCNQPERGCPLTLICLYRVKHVDACLRLFFCCLSWLINKGIVFFFKQAFF